MDSKVVNKAIAQQIRPVLKANGFTLFSTRTAWRHSDERIDVINFQSFNSYLANGLDCTTFSFAVNLGCFFCYIPDLYPIKKKNDQKLPKEYQCHFRSKLQRSFEQKELKRKDIWFVDPQGKYLPQAVGDVCSRITDTALPWFACFSRPASVLDVLKNRQADDTFWGFGNNPSPIRFYLTGHVARKLGEQELAHKCLQKAAESGCFKQFNFQ